VKIWIINHYANITFYNDGGRHYYFAKYLAKRGYEPVIFCSNAEHGTGKEYFENIKSWTVKQQESIDVPYIFIKSKTYVDNGKDRILSMIDFYRNVIKAAKEYIVTSGHPDIIYASSVHPLTLLAGLNLAKKYNVKCICEVRDLWPESFVAYGMIRKDSIITRILQLFEKHIYKKSDALIFTMEGGYDYIKERKWEKEVPIEKVYHINNGIDLNQYDDNKKNYIVSDEDLDNPSLCKVVYAGSIRKVNELGKLVEAAKLLKNKEIKLLIWGTGDELDELKNQVKRDGLTNITFKGGVDKKYIPYITSRADIIIVHGMESPILRFGMSENKVFDALAAGKPILVDFRSPHNPIIDNHAGIETKDNSPKEISIKLDEMSMYDNNLFDEMCSNARIAAKRYDFKQLTEQLISIIERVV